MKHNILKSLFISVILLAGTSNVWAGDPYISGFGLQFEDNSKWFKPSTEIMNTDFGSKTNFKIVYIYANGNKNGGNICDESYFKYEIYGTSGTQNWGGIKHSSVDWTTPTFKWGSENSSTAVIDLVKNRKPGDYRMEFYISFEGNSNSGQCGKWYDCKYSGGNWKFTWSIPDPTITISGANNLIVGTSANIKAQISNYPVGATISQVKVSGNISSEKSETGSSDNITISSVVPNASGKKSIKVIVTVKFGTGGTKDYTYDYDVTPPAVSDFKVTPNNVVSGAGTSEEPYVIEYGKSMTLTVSGNKAAADANSSLQAKFGDGSYSTTLTKTYSSISLTPQDVNVSARLYNSTATSHGAEQSTTIYYRAEEPFFNVTATATSGGLVTPTTATLMSQINGGDITAAPKPGYTFTDWTIATGAGYFGTTGTSTTSTTANTKFRPTQISTLLATFTPITYNINYNLNGGENHASNPANYTVETPTITLQAPTKAGYTFDGWYSDAEFTGEKVTTIAKGTTGNIELYAKWSETKYSVNINTNNRNWGVTTPSGANWVGPTPVNLTATPHTGYHFTEWKATGGASIADPNDATTTITATARGTVTAHFAETLHYITVQSSNDDHGTVTQSASQAGVTTAITITATPISGYEFTGWSKDGDIKDGDITIASINSATTTLTATGAGTVTANFAPKGSTPIYFKANHRWKQAGARFAVYYWDNKDENGWWDNMEEICGEDYYKAEVPAGCANFLIARLDPNNSNNNFTPADKGGPFWNQTADIVTPTDGKTMYNAQKVYFRPNANWKTGNARFAAYFYIEVNGKDTEHKWMSLLPTETDGLYWCDLPTTDDNGNPQYFDRVIFCRMDPNQTINSWNNRWNEAETQDILNINCFTITDGEWGKGKDYPNNDPAKGSWSLINDEATYNVTLYSCSFGEYGFIYNNVEYTSPESGSITYQIPINATVKVFSRPYSKEYRGDVMVNQSGIKWEITPDNPLLNITCNTILDDNYKTTGEHEVYLAVPHVSGDKTWWENHDSHTNYLYAFHDRTVDGNGYSVKMDEVGSATVEDQEHTYYRCVIPAEVNTIRFEKRSDATTTVLSTIDLRYDIPLNSVNCYRLDRPEGDKKAGIWEQAPGFGGDFRLVHYRTANDIYYSDIIRHGTISQVVSLHISTKDANAEPKLELQQRVNGNWVTVNGQTKLVKDIKKIMNDQQDNGCGVWNFTVTTDGADNAKVNFIPQRYTGNYYIRTNNAEGEWRNYTLSTNHMTFSSYAKNHSGYSGYSGYTHYYCRYIDLIDNSKVPGHNKNVKFIIANDYAANLSNEMIGDEHTTSDGDLPESANVRWTWNEVTNEVSRAYILGSHGSYDHIVANGNRLNDQEDWIYEIDIKNVTQGQKLNIHADYPSKDIGTVKKTTQTFADNLEMIKTDPSNQNSYTVRIMYDFKINKTLIMLEPNNKNVNIGVDVLIDRTDQREATQVRSTVTSDEGYTVYASLTLNKTTLQDATKTEWERLYYWISFPFDVRISEIFGFGEYGKHYIIQYYDGAARAENGCWADSPTYWRQITDTTYSARREADNNGNEDTNGNPNNGILVANKGYVLALARNIAKSDIFKYGNDYVRLYFPSREKIDSIDGNIQNTTVYLRPHTCNITREDRYIYDSNWHIIGVPSYADTVQTLAQDNLLYFYTYDTADNTYNVTPAENASSDQTITFKSMHAYMVQFAGNIHWQSTWGLQPQQILARRTAEMPDHYSLRLELQRDGQYADQAFVQLKAEGATADFDLNQDLTKIINAGANIYTLAGEKRIQVAGNVLPIAKTTIPVGIQVAQVGTYTIALPDGTSGISATLVDNQTGTHTNLLLEDYTVTLNAGTTEGRFYIVLDPERSATAVENIGEVQGDKTQKFLIDGQLIIKHDGIKYNVQGEKL